MSKAFTLIQLYLLRWAGMRKQAWLEEAITKLLEAKDAKVLSTSLDRRIK